MMAGVGKIENLTPFEPGRSGNPGGKTSAQRKLEVENAEKATRIRAALLAKVEALINPETGVFMDELEANLLKLIKDSEERGFGAPEQKVEVHDKGVIPEPLPDDDWAVKHGAD